MDLLTNNGNCRLPCLWGITPGETADPEAQTILIPLSSLSTFTKFRPGHGAFTPKYIEGDLRFEIYLTYLTDPINDNVKEIGFDAYATREFPGGEENIFDSEVFGEQFAFYRLPSILSRNGHPDSVLISTIAVLPPHDSPWKFEIVVIYPDQGILIRYTTEIQVVGSNVLGCPANAHIELLLYPSGHGDTFFDLLPQDWQNVVTNYRPLEDVTSMTLDEFYEKFRQPTDECIVTPSNLWPTPESGGG